MGEKLRPTPCIKDEDDSSEDPKSANQILNLSDKEVQEEM